MAGSSEGVESWRSGGGWPPRGLRARVVASILGITAWLVFLLLYMGFWAEGFSLGQSIIIFLVSLLILGGGLGAMWASWGMRFAAHKWST